MRLSSLVGGMVGMVLIAVSYLGCHDDVYALPPAAAPPPSVFGDSSEDASTPPSNDPRINDAVKVLASVWKSPALWAHLGARTWWRGPSGGLLTGDQAVSALRPLRPDVASFSTMPLARSESRVCKAPRADFTTVSSLPAAVGELARAYVLSLREIPAGSHCDANTGVDAPFLNDDDPATPKVRDVWLLSNAVADLAECIAEDRDDGAFIDACFSQHDEGGARRIVRECCGVPPTESSLRPNPTCGTYTCPREMDRAKK